MELFNYYSLDECIDTKVVINELKKLQKEGKVEFTLDKSTDILKIEDLDLEESDIENLLEIFEKNDVFQYLDMDDDVEDEDDYDDFYGEEDQY
jgi:hypothetical protein